MRQLIRLAIGAILLLGVNLTNVPTYAADEIIPPEQQIKDLQTILNQKVVVMVDRVAKGEKCLIFFADDKKAAEEGKTYIYVADCKLFDQLMQKRINAK